MRGGLFGRVKKNFKINCCFLWLAVLSVKMCVNCSIFIFFNLHKKIVNAIKIPMSCTWSTKRMQGVYSSVVEHSPAERVVLSSTLSGPFFLTTMLQRI